MNLKVSILNLDHREHEVLVVVLRVKHELKLRVFVRLKEVTYILDFTSLNCSLKNLEVTFLLLTYGKELLRLMGSF